MKNWFTTLRDSIIPPYCYAKACIGRSKTEIRCLYKKADFAELPDGLHCRFEFRICRSTITCDIRHGVCVSATLVPDKGAKYITYHSSGESDQSKIIEVRGNPSCPSVETLGVQARAGHEHEKDRPREG